MRLRAPAATAPPPKVAAGCRGAAWRLTGRRVGAATEREKLTTTDPHCSYPTEAVLGKDDW